MDGVLHIVPGLDAVGNGMAVAARLVASEQRAEVVDADAFLAARTDVRAYREVWVHSTWTPRVWRVCWRVWRTGVPLVRMPHGNLDPVRCRYHRWRKRLVAPIERFFFFRTARTVVTCAAEREWCVAWGVKGPFETVDLARHFPVLPPRPIPADATRVHVLYLGRRHPLKGVACLERAIAEVNATGAKRTLDLRCVSKASGDALEAAWNWCDVLCLPTLSENFGLVVAEALARGRRVIVTDGAPVWRDLGATGRLDWLVGYREGLPETRVALLRAALERVSGARAEL